eukprot:2264488-Rhodomonas_salina.1
MAGMRGEHCEGEDARLFFTTSNYGLSTCPSTEWEFVVEPSDDMVYPGTFSVLCVVCYERGMRWPRSVHERGMRWPRMQCGTSWPVLTPRSVLSVWCNGIS